MSSKGIENESNTDRDIYTIEEAVEIVKKIGLRFERQAKLKETAARIERERKIFRKKKSSSKESKS